MKVTVFNNGPLRVEGDITIVDANGKEYSLTQEKLSEPDRRYLKLQEIKW